MDMELTKKNINFYDTVLDTSALHEENIEIIVPDASPDMVRVVSANGCACVKDKNLRDGAIEINGMVKGSVLYLADGDKIVRKLDVNIPFSHTFEAPALSPDAKGVVTAQLVTLEAREINSRKLAVRAHVALDAKAYMEKQMEFCCEIPDAQEYSVETRKKQVSFYAPVTIKEKSFTITDDVEIPQTNPPFASMLRQDIDINCTDMKIIGNKAIMKGTACIQYAYNTQDDTVAVCEHELPYSQIIDIEGMEEDCDLTVKLTMRAAELDPAHDMTGDTRYISVNILVDACAIAYLKEEIEVIDDLYSTSYGVDAEFEETPCQQLCDHVSRRVAVNENIETASTVKRILDTHVILEPAHIKDSTITNDAQVQVLYIGEDDTLYCVMRRCSAECETNASGDMQYVCDAVVSGATANGMGNEISFRFFVDYDIREIAPVQVRHVSALKVEEEISHASDEVPAVIIKYVYTEQPIWNIAKAYHTTIEEIIAANGLDAVETVEAGSMLLIPRKG